MRIRERSVLALLVILVVGCTSVPIAVPSPAPTLATPTVARATAPPTPYATPSPLFQEGIATVPMLRPNPAFENTQISLKLPPGLGQPWQSFVWRFEPFHPDASYVDRVKTALGVSGPGTLGPKLGDTGPWRLWLGEKILAISEGDGTVVFFDPKADDGPRPPGPAQADPAGFLERLVNGFGPHVDYTPNRSWFGPFRGTSTTVYAAESFLDGSWSFADQPDSAVLFPVYDTPYGNQVSPPRIYGTDEMALLTSKGRPVELVHRPIGRLVSADLYWMNHYGATTEELLASPQKFLRYVSADPAGRLDLTVDTEAFKEGYAWADDGFPFDFGRSRQRLVPVTVFLANGTNGTGAPVTAMFVVDATISSMRAPLPPLTRSLANAADLILRRQFTMSVGGHRPQLGSASGAIEEYLGPTCAAAAGLTTVDADTVNAITTCDGSTVTMTVRRAWPGLPNSVWYVSDARKS